MISDAMIRTNSMEWTAGSPDLKPNRETYHTLRLSYSEARLQAYIEGFYKICHRPNMAVYERTADDQFILKSATIIQYTIKGRFMSR